MPHIETYETEPKRSATLADLDRSHPYRASGLVHRPFPAVRGCLLCGPRFVSLDQVSGCNVFLHEHTQRVICVIAKRAAALVASRGI
jgi:hypothetical protein